MKDENIAILLDQILEKLDQNARVNESDTHSTELDTSDLVSKEQADDIAKNQSLLAYRLNALLDQYIKLESTVHKWKPIHETKHHHDHDFFPGILKWLNSFRLWKVNLGLGLIVGISVFFNVHQYQLISTYKVGFLKYFLTHSHNLSVSEIEGHFQRDQDHFLHISDSLYHHDLEQIQLEERQVRIQKELEDVIKRKKELSDPK